MKLMVLILNKIEALDYFLESLTSAGIGGATIIESAGLAMTLSKLDSSFISASIRALFSAGDVDNRTILSVIKDDQLEIVRKVVYATIGDLSQPNTGILFTVPIDFAEGTKKNYSKTDDIDNGGEAKDLETDENGGEDIYHDDDTQDTNQE